MLKSIQLNLLKIKYNGDSIGDDIRAEIDVLGKFLRVDKRIKVGTTAEINREVGRFETDQDLFQTEISISIIEKDLLFNDVGGIKTNIKVNTTITKSQQFSFEIQVRENRSIMDKFWGKANAVFEIIFEAKASDAIWCVPDRGDGWIKVVLEKDKSKINLPAFLRVKIENSDRKREHFMILEGPYRGERASIVLRENGSSQFIFIAEYGSEALAKYSISKKIFILNGKEYKAADYPANPWKKGLYDIEIPDYPHLGGLRYLELAPKAKIWFRIGHTGERYLHTGSRSLGCITIIEKTLWSEIYNTLIKARKSDSISVGVLEVVD
ncbi:MAG: hypothetical protein NTW11_03300 [Candidatus Staskawiczbacteria bacterium]|nr:hypothetical protein [Candidatus Staskawiczbacteria bacterium]